MENVHKYLAEFLGTFTLVFIGTSVATLSGFAPAWGDSSWLGISAAFGFTLMVLVMAVGPISGCHLNPAVSIPMALSGRLKFHLLPGYLIAQILGGMLASFVLMMLLKNMPGYIFEKHGLAANGNPRDMAIGALLALEVIMTGLFIFVIFAATRGDMPIGSTALAIGGFLFVAHLVGAPLGDASLNPARSLGPAVFQRGEALNMLWVFIVGPVVGGLAGLGMYKGIYND